MIEINYRLNRNHWIALETQTCINPMRHPMSLTFSLERERFGSIIRCCANIILNKYYAKVRWHLKIPTVIYIFRFWINKNWIFFWPASRDRYSISSDIDANCIWAMIKISIFGDNIFLLSLVQIKMLEASEDKKRLYYNKFHSTISILASADSTSVIISAEK